MVALNPCPWCPQNTMSAYFIEGLSGSRHFGRSAAFRRSVGSDDGWIRIALAIAIVFFAVGQRDIPVIRRSATDGTAQQLGFLVRQYCVRVEDIAAIRWLQHRVEGSPRPGSRRRPLPVSASDVRPDPDGIFPALVRKVVYVFVTDATTEHVGITVFIDGDLVATATRWTSSTTTRA